MFSNTTTIKIVDITLLNTLKNKKLKKQKILLRPGFIGNFWVILGGFFNANSGYYAEVLVSAA